MNRFKVVIPAYNCLNWLPRCLNSIASQSYRDFDLVLIDDSSDQEGQWEWTERYCRNQGWLAIRNEKREGIIPGLIQAIRAADCTDEDVIITVDGDDWLAHDQVFARLKSIYSEGKVDLTYGQFVYASTGHLGFSRPYDPDVKQERSYRGKPTRWSHLRTFKSFLWRAIDDRSLRTPGGGYYRYATDHAFMNPMLEMAGDRVLAIDEVLYVYNNLNAHSESRRFRDLHLMTRHYIHSQPPYPLLDRCRDGHSI